MGGGSDNFCDATKSPFSLLGIAHNDGLEWVGWGGCEWFAWVGVGRRGLSWVGVVWCGLVCAELDSRGLECVGVCRVWEGGFGVAWGSRIATASGACRDSPPRPGCRRSRNCRGTVRGNMAAC